MPRIKPFVCHRCGLSYTGRFCPCRRKPHKSSGAGRSTSRRTFSASSVLGRVALGPVARGSDDGDKYSHERICKCGYLTTTEICTYCGKAE